MNEVCRLRLFDSLPAGGFFHALRKHIRDPGPRGAPRMRLHCHDFAEVFWIEHGKCLHHLAGSVQELVTGDIVLVRPGDKHHVSPGQGGCTLVNIAFAAEELARVRQRLYSGDVAFPWDSGGQPRRCQLSVKSLARLRSWGDRLVCMRQDRVEFEAFLLDLLATCSCGSGDGRMPVAGPPWFVDAVRTFSEPGHLAEGLPALVRLCGRGREHMNRTCQRYSGMTATDLVNHIRLDHAAAWLRESDESILTVALTCGFNSLGYFYRRFHARFGETPRRWRQRQVVE